MAQSKKKDRLILEFGLMAVTPQEALSAAANILSGFIQSLKRHLARGNEGWICQ